MKRVIIPLPDKDFDTTEVSVPWKRFRENGFEVIFATENKIIPETDPLLLTGVIFGQLGAEIETIEIYREMQKSEEFQNPIAYSEINPESYDLLHLAGGHAKGMKQYLESKVLQEKVVEFFRLNKLVGSICHGGIVLARSIDEKTGKSVIYKKNLTALTKILERTAYYITAWKLGDYYRTYPEYVQDEVSRNLKDNSQFKTGSLTKPFVVTDGNLVTARYPKDAEFYTKTLIEKIKNG